MADERAPLLDTNGSSSTAAGPNQASPPRRRGHLLTSHWSWTPSPRSSSSSRHHHQQSTYVSSLSAVAAAAEEDVGAARARLRRFLTSRWGHYTVIALVAVDVASIFGGFLATIFQCELKCDAADKGGWMRGADERKLALALDVFEAVSLVVSCLFMIELLASLWAFGLRYLTSWFHILDASVIIASFVIDVGLKGVLSEAGSIVVVLRLWRVFKIIEEFSAGADEKMDGLNEHIEKLISENKDLRKQLASARDPDADN